MRDLQLKQLCWAWLVMLWSASAAAAQATAASDLSSIPPAAVAIAVVLSLLGGAGATLQKMASPETVIKSLRIEVSKDIVISLLAGLVTYSICAWQEVPLLLQPACIALAGYGGSRILERYLAAGLNRIDRLGGQPPSPPPESLP